MVQFNIKPLPVVVILVIFVLFGAYRYGAINRLKLSNSHALETRPPDQSVRDTVTGVNILDFFKTSERDGMKITWSHRTNQLKQLESALIDSTVLMIEADVRLNSSENVPVMAHEESDISASDLKLDDWLKKVIDSKSQKGIKLDIKTTNALEPTLKVLKSVEESLKIPVMINSDILVGPNSKSKNVDAAVFFDFTKKIFPHCTLSVGWSTGYNSDGDNEVYTTEMINEMETSIIKWVGYVTFPVRASLMTKTSIEPFKTLLNKLKRYSLTVWENAAEEVKIEDLILIRKSFPYGQVFYDLSQNTMKKFQNALNNE